MVMYKNSGDVTRWRDNPAYSPAGEHEKGERTTLLALRERGPALGLVQIPVSIAGKNRQEGNERRL